MSLINGPVNEDSLYRQSSQFQEWTFTRAQLHHIRTKINENAASAVRRRVARATKRAAAAAAAADKPSSSSPANTAATAAAVEPLSVEEEQQLVAYYCSFCLTLGKSMKFPTMTMATAIQFIKRFFVYNSTMEHHPKQIALSALFFASKSDNFNLPLADFVAGIVQRGKVKKTTTAESVLEHEFALCQGLRFSFQTTHPHRGLKGHLILLLTLLSQALPAGSERVLTPNLLALRTRLSEHPLPPPVLPAASPSPTSGPSPSRSTPTPNPATGPAGRIHSFKELQDRVTEMYKRARLIVDAVTPITDAYFLYTPAQICFATLLLADEPLAILYIMAILNAKSTGLDIFAPPFTDQYEKILAVIRDCSKIVQVLPIHKTTREELVNLDKRLFLCLNPKFAAEKFLNSDPGENASRSGTPTVPTQPTVNN